MNREKVIILTEEFVRTLLKGFDSGHDWWHIERVRKIARYINEKEKIADPYILEIAVLLHDTADSKFYSDNPADAYKVVEDFMISTGLTSIKNQILDIIRNVSFSNKMPSGDLKDPVLLVLQDADKIDALGAIGIARAFNYGGFRNNAIYIPDDQSRAGTGSTIGHFYEKLLKLKDLMNTPTGRRIAGERHAFLEKYLDQFYKEWGFGS